MQAQSTTRDLVLVVPAHEGDTPGSSYSKLTHCPFPLEVISGKTATDEGKGSGSGRQASAMCELYHRAFGQFLAPASPMR